METEIIAKTWQRYKNIVECEGDIMSEELLIFLNSLKKKCKNGGRMEYSHHPEDITKINIILKRMMKYSEIYFFFYSVGNY